MRKERKHYTAEEKVAILRRHLLDKLPVSDLCEELGLRPTVFYRWQKEFFENGAAAFQGQRRPDHQAEQQRIEFLEKKIQTKDEVLAELMAEHIALKKILGSSDQSVGAARCTGPGGGFRPALVEEDRDRRGTFHSVEELERAIYAWLASWNDTPKPFVWKATADDILDKVRRCKELAGRHTRCTGILLSLVLLGIKS